MPFSEELRSICDEIPGAQAAVVMSLDGIPVASHEPGPADLDTEVLLVELIGPLRQAAEALGAARAGGLEAAEFASAGGTLLVRMLNDEHFLALVLAPQAVVGRGRWIMRRHAPALRGELA